jgi:hypothetical protein
MRLAEPPVVLLTLRETADFEEFRGLHVSMSPRSTFPALTERDSSMRDRLFITL